MSDRHRTPQLVLAFLLTAAISTIDAISGPARAADFIVPGIYQLEAGSHLSTSEKAADIPGRKTVERFGHAIPDAAGVTHAVVSHEPGSNRNRVLFLVAKDYRTDVNSANKLCVAYAFPDWNDYSPSEPFCRTRISNEYEAILNGSDAAFTVGWLPATAFLRTEPIPAERPPTPSESAACTVFGACEPAAFGHTIDRYEITYRNERFTLETPRAYQDVLFLGKDVPVFAQADRASARTALNAGSHVAVLASRSDWVEIESFDQDGSATHGWIDRDDIRHIRWVEQRAMTRDFRFRVAFPAENDATEGNAAEPVSPAAIEVIDRKTGRRTQVIRDFMSDPWGEPGADFLQLVDANFDGHPDIDIFGMSGGAGPNSTRNLFLFDAATRRFVFDETLSGLPQLHIDPRTRTIHSAQRGGCCNHSSETYRYIGGRLTLVASWEQSWLGESRVETTTGRLRNGKMQHRTTRSRAK